MFASFTLTRFIQPYLVHVQVALLSNLYGSFYMDLSYGNVISGELVRAIFPISILKQFGLYLPSGKLVSVKLHVVRNTKS